MPKGARRTVDQRLAAAEAMVAKAQAEMDRQATPLGYMVTHAKNLPTERKLALASILFEANEDRGDRERLLKALQLPTEVLKPFAPIRPEQDNLTPETPQSAEYALTGRVR